MIDKVAQQVNAFPWSRRDFVRASGTVLGVATVPRWGSTTLSRHARAIFADRQAQMAVLSDPKQVRAMAMAAIDTARSAGATYADVRLTRTVMQWIRPGYGQPDVLGVSDYDGIVDDEELAIGVRALVNGTWGFTTSAIWTIDEAVQLARDAAAIAGETAKYAPMHIEFASTPAVTGSWSTPIRIDPFSIPIEEKIDFAESLRDIFYKRYTMPDPRWWGPDYGGSGGAAGPIRRCERAVATTDGSYVTQTTYATSTVGCGVRGLYPDGLGVPVGPDPIAMAGAGWEFLLDAKLEEQFPRLLEESHHLVQLPHKPVNIGRYDVVCDAATMCSLVEATLAQATELDRALGYEANASGTSWLGPDPFAVLGTEIGSPLLTLRANRSLPKGLATVKWDDESIPPGDVPLIQDGVLVDYQTIREQVHTLAPWYRQHQQPLRSHGGAGAESAAYMTQERAANIVLAPGKAQAQFEDLVANTKKGLAFFNMGGTPDFQQRGITARALNPAAQVREIVDGKLGAVVDGVGFLIDAAQLWKNLTAIGGPGTEATMWAYQLKGEPPQQTMYSIQAVPGSFKNITIIDPARMR